MEEYGNYISVALLPLLAILQPHRWKFFSREEVDLMKRNDIGQVVYEDVEGNSHVVEVVVGTRSFFDGQSTIHVDLDTPWINIDISQMIDANRPIAEAIAANYLNENFVKKNSSNPRKAKKESS